MAHSDRPSTQKSFVAAAIVAAALGATTGGGAIPSPPPVDRDTVPVVADRPGIYGAGAESTRIIEESISRYEEVGLPLPALRIYVHNTKEGCSGASGRFGMEGDDHRVDLCGEIRSHLIVLHELAHAWEHHHVSEATRRAFLERTGLVWSDPQDDWGDRGVEALANTISWGIVPDAPLRGEPSEDILELLQRFELLTGFASPRLNADRIPMRPNKMPGSTADTPGPSFLG